MSVLDETLWLADADLVQPLQQIVVPLALSAPQVSSGTPPGSQQKGLHQSLQEPCIHTGQTVKAKLTFEGFDFEDGLQMFMSDRWGFDDLLQICTLD